MLDKDAPVQCIQAGYQCHVSSHHKNCFRCNKLQGKQKKDHICGKACECRYRLPDRARPKSTVRTINESTNWYEWTGERRQQPLVHVLPKRNQYDLFQNVSCHAVSESKFTCNSNVNIITDGPIGMYTVKYVVKDNTSDDTAEYSEMDASMKKMGDRTHDDDRAEALRIICRAAFAHNKQNVISAPMASFLLRNESRFYFSHKFVFCPLKDVVRLHNKQEVNGTLNVPKEGSTFFENLALHYLCRHEDLEDVCLKDFCENYEVVYCPARQKKDNPVLPMIADTGLYCHPSAAKKGKGKKAKTICQQGAKAREDTVYAKVPQWNWPDTAEFHENILTCADTDINRSMELYSQLVLSLFVPHRSSQQLMHETHDDYPYTYQLRRLYDEDTQRRNTGGGCEVFTDKNLVFLQNIQNCAYNSLRYKATFDDLAADTQPFENYDPTASASSPKEDAEEEEENPLTKLAYEDFLEEMEYEFDRPLNDEDPQYFFNSLKNFTFKHIRNSGDRKCGYGKDIDLPDLKASTDSFVKETHLNTRGQGKSKRGKKRKRFDEPKIIRKYGVKEINEVLLKKSTRSHKNVWKGKDINVEDATGSIRSIREWSTAAFSSDKRQERAFEVIIAAFLLTFYEDAAAEENASADVTVEQRMRFRRTRAALLKLKGQGDEEQLICLLHGPGGSGKSTVINMVIAYAKSYCESIQHDFTNRTIVVTAMSGVAATLLHGETTHMCIGMNRTISKEDIRDFSDARLIIIDEISFAGIPSFERIHECLKTLMENPYLKYGGINVVFAGDYSQLEPVRQGKPVYKESHVPEFHGTLNCFMELNGTHRFRDDPEYGERLSRFRRGEPTRKDISAINDACHVDVKRPPKGIQVATRLNKNRDAVNSAIFEDFCKEHRPTDGSVLQDACMIFMDELEMTNSAKEYVDVKSNSLKRFFLENCGEDDCKLPKSSKGRVDPILKIYPGCPMMLTENKDVKNGQANGSRVHVKGIALKPGEEKQIVQLDCGTKIVAVNASQVDHIEVEHAVEDISPRTFQVTTKKFTFKSKMEIADEERNVAMRGVQFPIISNSCTTGHKLQGCTVDEILVNDWHYGQNWEYVVLSRVRTMAGLYIREPLSYDLKKYKKDPRIQKMLTGFCEKFGVFPMTDEEYTNVLKMEEMESSNRA